MGNEKHYTIQILSSAVGACLTIDDTRVAGPKSSGASEIIKSFIVSEQSIFNAMEYVQPYSFESDIKKFNEMYKLPVQHVPSTNIGSSVVERFTNFKNILRQELDEIDHLISKVSYPSPFDDELDVLVELADLLADIQIYCASEMVKFGLPISNILQIVMASNFSKLGADGKPIYDERGKVQKGPNYYKPEPAIRDYLEFLQALSKT